MVPARLIQPLRCREAIPQSTRGTPRRRYHRRGLGARPACTLYPTIPRADAKRDARTTRVALLNGGFLPQVRVPLTRSKRVPNTRPGLAPQGLGAKHVMGRYSDRRWEQVAPPPRDGRSASCIVAPGPLMNCVRSSTLNCFVAVVLGELEIIEEAPQVTRETC